MKTHDDSNFIDSGHRITISGGEVIDLDETMSMDDMDYFQHKIVSQHKIMSWLDDYKVTKDEISNLLLAMQDIKESLIPPDIREKLKEVDVEFNSKVETAQSRLSDLESSIKAGVLVHGKTVSTVFFHAEWKKGRAGTWDSKKLELLSEKYKEILLARNPAGDPICAIVARKQN